MPPACVDKRLLTAIAGLSQDTSFVIMYAMSFQYLFIGRYEKYWISSVLYYFYRDNTCQT